MTEFGRKGTEETTLQAIRRVEQGTIAGNTATGWLKILALCFMLVDHMGKMLFPTVLEMRMVGRIAFPLYAWCMVVGFHYTRSPFKYALRVLAVGVASQPFYMKALDHAWYEPNIFLSLFLALMALWAMEPKSWEKSGWTKLAGRALAAAGVLAALVLATVLGCDYGWRGVLLVLLLHAAREKSGAIAAVMMAFCLYWGSTSGSIASLFGYPISLSGTASALLSPWMKVQAMAILALPLMLWPMKTKLRIPTWLGYALYPLHLALLMMLEHILGV